MSVLCLWQTLSPAEIYRGNVSITSDFILSNIIEEGHKVSISRSRHDSYLKPLRSAANFQQSGVAARKLCRHLYSHRVQSFQSSTLMTEDTY